MATSPYKNVSFYGQGPLNQIQRDYAPSMQMAQQLMANGSNTAPVQSPLEGIARALQGGLGGYTNYATMKAMGDRQTALNTDMMAALGASKAQEFDRPTPDFVGPMQGSPGGTQGMIAELQKRNNPDALPFMMQLQNDQIQQEKAARLLTEQRKYTERQSVLSHKRALEIEDIKRQNDINDKTGLERFKNNLGMDRDRQKSIDEENEKRRRVGLPPLPSAGASAPQSQPSSSMKVPTQNSNEGGPQPPPMTLAEAEAQAESRKAVSIQKAKSQDEARANLPTVLQNADNLLSIIDKVATFDDNGNVKSTHPGFESMVGMPSWGGITDRIPFIGGPIHGTESANFGALLDQIGGKQFLEAFQSIKGGGSITETEGRKAQDAIARMKKAQTEEDFLEGLKEFRTIVKNGAQRARERAGEMSLVDAAAKEWAMNNPNDPRAKQIKQRLGF